MAVNIGTPLFVAFQNPLLQPILILVQWKIPVLGRLLYETMTRVVLVGRVDELLRREGSTTFLALVAISTLCTTARASSYDITVGKEFACYLVAELLLYLFFQYALIIECAEEV